MTEQERLALEAALQGVEEPVRPVDGDCGPWTKWVVQALREADLPAEARTVFGLCRAESTVWSSAGPVVLFGHSVALVGTTVVVDFTARQFDADLPARWITTVEEYRRQLATATGADEVVLL